MSSHTIIVLGMHRSGTSCLTGQLQQAGLELGDVVEQAPHNRNGNRENLDIRALNDTLLAYNNAAWDSPPTEISWNSQHQAARDAIIQLYADSAVWRFKDPRTMFTLPFWLEGLDEDKLQLIAIYRNPYSVAKSLNARQPDLTIEKGLALWREYNEKLLDYHKQYDFPVLNFDLDPTSYLQAFHKAVQSLGKLSISADKKLDFFDDALRHQNAISTAELQQYARILAPEMLIHQQLGLLTSLKHQNPNSLSS